MPRPAQPPRQSQRNRAGSRLWTFAARLLRATTAAVILTVLLAGVPWGLAHYVGWPLPTHLPGWDDVLTALSTPLTSHDTLRILACVLWPTWALFLFDVGRCLVDTFAALPRPHLTPSTPTYALAAALIGMLALGPPSTNGLAATSGGLTVQHTEPIGATDQPARTAITRSAPQPNLATRSTEEDQQATVTVRPPHDGVYDSLWHIAERTLGDGVRWPEIFRLNEGRPQPDGRTLTHPNLIRPGWILELPRAATPAPDGSEKKPENDSSTHDDDQEQPSTDATPSPAPSQEPPQDQASPTPGETDTTPSTPAGPPSQTPARPAPSPTAPTDEQAPGNDHGITTSTGAFVSVSLAALITVVWCTLRIRRRVRYRPGTAHQDEPTMAPIVRAMRVAHDRPPPTEDSDPLELEPASSPATGAVPEAAVRERARAVLSSIATDENPVTGTRDGRSFAIDLARTRGLGLTGPGAHPAARALLGSLLADHHRSGAGRTRLLIPAADATQLLGRDAARPPHPPRLRITDNLDDAVAEMEAELLTRSREPDKGDPEELVLVATPHPDAARRLQGLLDNGSVLGLTGILLGPWHPGTTLRVREDGTIAAANPAAPPALSAGARLFTLPETDARDLLGLLADLLVTAPPASTATKPLAPGRVTPPAPSTASAGHGTSCAPATPDPPPQCTDLRAHQRGTQPAAARSRERPQADPTPAVRLVVLGRVHLVRCDDEDDAVKFPLSPRHRELLTFLALHRRGAHRDTICASLWPESRRPHNAFHATLSQLRRSLTIQDAALEHLVEHREGHYRLNDRLISVDLWELHEKLAAFTSSTPGEQGRFLSSIGGLYQEGLAIDLTSEWLEAPREATRREVLNAYSAFIHSLHSSDAAKALQLLEDARQLDPYNEAVYREIARLQARLGQWEAIPRTFDLLASVLTELDEQPSAATRQYFDRVQKTTPPDTRVAGGAGVDGRGSSGSSTTPA